MSNNELNIIEYRIISGPNERFNGLNSELMSNDKLNINESSSQNQKYDNSLSSESSDLITESSIDLIEFLDVDKLILFVIKKHDRGITFDQFEQFISKKILQTNQAADQFIKWLSSNQDKSKYIWFLGLYYYYNICVKENTFKAFELFSKAANNNYSIAQVYLAKCYYNGYGVNYNRDMAFYWYKKSVENGSIAGQFYLGYCYEFGIGIIKDEKQSVYWYDEAAKNGNTTVKLYLAHTLL